MHSSIPTPRRLDIPILSRKMRFASSAILQLTFSGLVSSSSMVEVLHPDSPAPAALPALATREEAVETVREFNRGLHELSRATDAALDMPVPESETCPPATFRLSLGMEVDLAEGGATPWNEGTLTRLFVGSTEGGIVVIIKVLDGYSNSVYRRALITDKAFLSVLSHHRPRIVPLRFSIDDGDSLSAHCRARTVVSEFTGRYNLQQMPHSIDRARLVMAKAIGLVWQLHSFGFVHGDIYSGNFVFNHLDDVAKNLRLVDFGRTEPWMNEFGRHRDNGVVLESTWSVALASPWEIAGSRLSRRDDLFRLAEVALEIAGVDGPFSEAVKRLRQVRDITKNRAEFRASMIKLKNERPIAWEEIPVVFREFYEHTRHLKWDETIDYAHWISEFANIA